MRKHLLLSVSILVAGVIGVSAQQPVQIEGTTGA